MALRIAYLQQDPKPTRRPKKDAGYLGFVRQLPCAVTGQYGVEAAHVSFANPWYGHYGRGRGTKAPDRFALPLSPEAHRSQHSGNEAAWWAARGIDPHDLANTLWGLWTDYGEDAAPLCTARINAGLASTGRLPKTRD